MEEQVPKVIEVLFVEDAAEQAVLVEHALDKSGLAHRSTRVSSREALLDALKQQPPDVIPADYSLHSLSGLVGEAVADSFEMFAARTELDTARQSGGSMRHGVAVSGRESETRRWRRRVPPDSAVAIESPIRRLSR